MSVNGDTRQLVLWDVDGTLVDCAGLGRDAFVEAFERAAGAPPRELVPFAGRTDMEIALHMFERNGLDGGEELLERFLERLAAAMAARAGLLRARGRALPGARAALERLGSEPRVRQSLLTGNIAANAVVKLAAFELDAQIDFEIGAYGSDHRVRGELVAIARNKAERRHGIALEPAAVVMVGDTPLDIAAARAGGARAVGVGTGPYDQASLWQAGADAVLPDLADTSLVVEALISA